MSYFMKALITSAAICSLSLTAAQAAQWDMPTPYPDQTFHTVNISEFAKDVEKRTNGALKIKVHPAGALIKHKEIKNAVRSGEAPIGELFMGLLANESPIYGADTQPFLATNYDDAAKLWAAQKDPVTKLFAKQGLIPLFSVPWPPQGLYAKKEMKSVDDFKGLKFRSYNATLEKFAKLAGAAPTQVSVPDIPVAFKTGRVEAMITSPSTGANSKAWDFVNRYYDIQAWIPKNVVVVNKKAFDALDKKVQEAVLAAAAEAEKRGWEMSKKETSAKTDILKKNGMTYNKPAADSDLVKGLKDIGSKMLVDWKKASGADGEALIKAYEGK